MKSSHQSVNAGSWIRASDLVGVRKPRKADGADDRVLTARGGKDAGPLAGEGL